MCHGHLSFYHYGYSDKLLSLFLTDYLVWKRCSGHYRVGYTPFNQCDYTAWYEYIVAYLWERGVCYIMGGYQAKAIRQ